MCVIFHNLNVYEQLFQGEVILAPESRSGRIRVLCSRTFVFRGKSETKHSFDPFELQFHWRYVSEAKGLRLSVLQV